MTAAALARRTVLRSGAALAGPLAFASLWPRSAPAALAPACDVAGRPLSGTVLGWVSLDPDQNAVIRVVQLDAASRATRQLAASSIALDEPGGSLHRICQQAHAVLVRAVAASWRVPATECSIGVGRITSRAGRHAVDYALWMDVA